jgi:dTDP-4-dehydrorhamnose 3,5-epimerase
LLNVKIGEFKMSKFKRIETGIEGLVVIEPTVFGDDRGFFMESYSKKDFEEIGLNMDFVQDNHSKSKKGVLRGLHFQTKHTQGKLVRVIAGSVLDVAVDLRDGSKTFGQHFIVELTEQNKKMFYMPEGFAHGFLTLEDDTEFQYKCTDYYAPEFDSGVLWNAKDININWDFEKYGLKEEEILLSGKDKVQQTLKEFIEKKIKL